MPKQIRFIEGLHKGLVFTQGNGPAKRIDIGSGVTWLADSTNFWYNGNRSVSADYLNEYKSQWEVVQS